jgi:probable LLM family oxidoreductase
MTIKLGLDTFGDISSDENGNSISAAQTIRNVVEQAVVADQTGVDAFGIGEHHRDDYAVSSPEMVLAAIASRTEKISLGSAVTVLSSDDPVRVFQRFSTLDAVSNGRAEIMAGRGSFVESFPLFGYSLSDYDDLYAEKLDLLHELVKEKPVTWSGRTRAALHNQNVYPHTETGKLKLWVAVGGTPSSVMRAAHYGLPVAFAIIGGAPGNFKPLVDLYKKAVEEEHSFSNPVGMHSMGHVAETDAQAREEFYPYYETFHNRLGAERGWGRLTPPRFLQEIENGSLYVGSPETVGKKIASTVKTLGVERFDLKYATGEMPHSSLMKSVELYGTKVASIVKNELN